MTLVLCSAVGDTPALPFAIAAAFVVVALIADRGERLPPLAAMSAALFAAYALARSHFSLSHLEVAGPLVLAASAIATTERPRIRVPIAVLSIGSAVVLASGSPPLGMRLVILGALLASPVAFALEAAATRELLTWGAAVVVATLSKPEQAPSVVCWTLAAQAMGRLAVVRGGSGRGVLCATLSTIGIRLGLVALFEGGFSIDRLEIAVGYVGNPGTDHGFGTLLVVTKLVAEMFLCLSFVTLEMAPEPRRRVVAAVVAFFLLRIGHVVLSMTVARGTFYAPWSDAGHLLFLFLWLATTGVAAVVLASPRGSRP